MRESFKVNTFLLVSLVVFVVCFSGTLFAESQKSVELNFLGGNTPETLVPITLGVPWERGLYGKDTSFAVVDSEGNAVDASTWTMAYWPDGSLKFTGLTIAADSDLKIPLTITAGESKPVKVLEVKEAYDNIIINTGSATYDINTKGDRVIESVDYDGRIVAEHLQLVAYVANTTELTAPNSKTEKYISQFTKCTLEQNLPTRAVIKAEGKFKCKETGRELLPFVLRLYFVAGVDTVKTVFTFIYDGDQNRDFISGLAMIMDVPMREDVNNRHVMFAGENEGTWHEPVRPLAGRSSGIGRLKSEGIFEKQMNIEKVAVEGDFDAAGKEVLRALPIWGNFKLSQVTSDSFLVHKRPNVDSSWLKANWGNRSRGTLFAGDMTGGVAMGLKDFWQSFPAALEISDAQTHKAKAKVWIWSPEGGPMDLRHYDTERHSLTATYEDAEVGFSTPYGVARTSEISLKFFGAPPTIDQFTAFANDVAEDPILVCSPEHYYAAKAFGIWSLPDRSTESKRKIEDILDNAFDFYKGQIDQRHWYGFWNYGDIRHSYDAVRRVWCYDIGGNAWTNTEIAPNMWLWHMFLRSGRADVFRVAEAMTRHTSEVDVHHIGPFKGIGSRHNVSHWGGGCKQVRISHAGLHRIYYFLTADERIGDFMTEALDSDSQSAKVKPLRKFAKDIAKRDGVDLSKYDYPVYTSIGTSWVSFVANWATEWERTGDEKYLNYIKVGMDSIVDMPYGIFTSSMFGYDPKTKKMYNVGVKKERSTGHLAYIMGGYETMVEVLDLIDHPEFEKDWLEYCRRYGWGRADWKKIGQRGKQGGIIQWHSRAAGYAANKEKDAKLAKRAWWEFLDNNTIGKFKLDPQVPVRISGNKILNPVDEAPYAGSNHYSQWCLSAIANLELIGDYLPEKIESDNK